MAADRRLLRCRRSSPMSCSARNGENRFVPTTFRAGAVRRCAGYLCGLIPGQPRHRPRGPHGRHPSGLSEALSQALLQDSRSGRRLCRPIPARRKHGGWPLQKPGPQTEHSAPVGEAQKRGEGCLPPPLQIADHLLSSLSFQSVGRDKRRRLAACRRIFADCEAQSPRHAGG